MKQRMMRNKKHFPWHKGIALGLAASLLLGQVGTLNTEAAKSVSQLQKEQKELQKQIDALDSDLVELLADINELESEISSNQAEIQATEAELVVAEQAVDDQYAAMKIRIQYMYENDNKNVLAILLESGSIADFLNRLEYVNSIYASDRNLLENYEATKSEIQMMKEGLEEEKADLQNQKSSLSAKKNALNTKIATMEGQMDDYDDQIAEAKALAARQAELERQRREEEQRRQEQAAANNAGNNSSGGSSNSSGGSKNPGYTTGVSGSAVVSYANTFVGKPYKWGGTNPNTGADCSGFVQYVFAHFGITWSGRMTSYTFRNVGKEVSRDSIQPGDIVCYAGHVAIYAGNGKIVEAQSTAAGITNNRSVDNKKIITIRRVL